MIIQEHPAFVLTRDHAYEMLCSMQGRGFDGIDEKAKYMEKYLNFPMELQLALGYIKCFIEACETSSAYGEFCMEMFLHNRVPPMTLPLRFVGFAGEHSNIGPAYELRDLSLWHTSRMFYTDDDIESNKTRAEWLLEEIEAHSSGLCDFKVEKLSSLQGANGVDTTPRYCITFGFDKAACRDTVVSDKVYKGQEENPYVFVLAKSGEFNCLMGEMVNGKEDSCFILANHSYCMK